MLGGILLALHLLGVVVWVGGIAFVLLVLRPGLMVLQPPERIAAHTETFRRFFRIVWHVMPLVIVTGYLMLFAVYGGFARVNWSVHVMHLTGLLMAALFFALFFGPYKALRRGGGVTALGGIRRLATINLALGLLTIVVAALGAG